MSIGFMDTIFLVIQPNFMNDTNLNENILVNSTQLSLVIKEISPFAWWSTGYRVFRNSNLLMWPGVQLSCSQRIYCS